MERKVYWQTASNQPFRLTVVQFSSGLIGLDRVPLTNKVLLHQTSARFLHIVQFCSVKSKPEMSFVLKTSQISVIFLFSSDASQIPIVMLAIGASYSPVNLLWNINVFSYQPSHTIPYSSKRWYIFLWYI